METRIGISQAHTSAVAQVMSRVLADEFVLYTKTRNAHWNVVGSDFYAKHKFFEDQYDELDELIDEVAERIRAIGHYAPATLKNYLQLTRLTETPMAQGSSEQYIRELLADHEAIIFHLRENINRFATEYQDVGTSDFITGLMEKHEKMAWMLRAHLA